MKSIADASRTRARARFNSADAPVSSAESDRSAHACAPPRMASAAITAESLGFGSPVARARMTPEEQREYFEQVKAHIAVKLKDRKSGRIPCQGKRRRDGMPCEAKSEPGKRFCRFHGGRATGPRTPEGKAKAPANLKRGRERSVKAEHSAEAPASAASNDGQSPEGSR